MMDQYISFAREEQPMKMLKTCLETGSLQICMSLPREISLDTTGPERGGGGQFRVCIQKFPDWVDNETNNNSKHPLRSNTKGYGGKTH
jgi:hypothetical protein